MKRVLGKSGWVALLLLPVAFLTWSYTLGFAAEETFDSDATTVTIRANTRYIKAGQVEGGRDTTAFTISNDTLTGVLYANISTIPAGQAILAAHIRVVTNKAGGGVPKSATLYRLTADSDSASVSWLNAKTGTAWGQPGANDWITNKSSTGAYGDSMFTSTTYDRLQFGSGVGDAGASSAGDDFYADVSKDVRMAYANDRPVIGWLFAMSDTASGTNGLVVRWGQNATTTDRPELTITYGPVATGGGSSVVGRNGRGIN